MLEKTNDLLINKISKSFDNFYIKYKKNRKTINIVSMIVLYIMTFFMFYYIETKMDDNAYKVIVGVGTRLSSLKDIWLSQYNHYMSWSGRAVCHTVLQIMFLAGRFWASLFYAAIFVLLVYEISSFFGREHNYILLIAALMYFINPNFEESIRWRTGFCNYAMNMTLVLIACKPFVMYLRDDNYTVPKYYFFLLPISLLAGNTIENIATTMCMMQAFVLFYKLFIKKDRSNIIYYLVSFMLCCIGCGIMIFAPGNSVRIGVEEMPGLLNIAYRGYGQVMSWFNWLLPSMVIFAILYFINKKNKVKTNYLFTITMLVWFAMNNVVMVAATTYPLRASFCPFIIMFLLIIDELDKIYKHDKTTNKFIDSLGIVMFVSYIFTLLGIDVLSCARRSGIDIPG